MNLLISGGMGFIGSHFVRHCLGKPDVDWVINIDAMTYAANRENLSDVESNKKHVFLQMDVNDPMIDQIIKQYGITHIAHLAAETHVDRSIHNPDLFISSNVCGTANLLKAARGHVRRFLLASTDEVYGPIAKGFCDETTPLRPSSPYSASKAGAEMIAMAYHRTYKLDTVITRSSNNYGTHQYPEKLIPVVIRSIKYVKPIPVYGTGENVRDWMHVNDQVRGLWAVLVNGLAGEVYNISSMKPCANIDLICAICDLIDPLTRALVRFVGDRDGHDERYAPDSTKIRKKLGWCPTESMASGLPGVIEWYMGR